MKQISRWLCFIFILSFLALSCLSCSKPQTLDSIQQQAYKALEEKNTEQAYEIVLKAEALYPGELDSALYQLLINRADGDLAQDAALAAYETLFRREELTLPQMFALGQYYQAQGELRQARDLYELCLRREENEEIYALLQSMTISFDQEDTPLQTYLLQAGSAAKEGRMTDLIELFQSTEWLNEAMPEVGNGGRFYENGGETEKGSPRIRVAAELTEDNKPVTSIWVLETDGTETSIRVSPEAISLITGSVHEGSYQGTVTAEILEISSETFYQINANLKNDLFSGEASFQLFSSASDDSIAARWEHRQDAATGTFSGAFSEDGHPQAQQQDAVDAVVVGYDTNQEKYLALHIPEGMSAQDSVSILWMPVAKAWEGQ